MPHWFSKNYFTFMRFCVWGTVLTTLLVLIGWVGEIAVFKTVLPGYISMKANTAIGLLFLAFSLHYFHQLQNAYRIKFSRLGTRIMAFIPFMIGVLTLSEYIFDWNLGIDEFFFLDPIKPNAKFPAGRLAPITAINFIFVSISIFLVSRTDKPQRYRISQYFLLIAFLMSFQALIGYFMGIKYAFGSAYYTQMAIHTAFLFILVTAGFLFAQRNSGIMQIVASDGTAGKSARSLITAAILVPPLVNFIQIKGEEAQFYDDDFSVLIRVMGNVIFFLIIIWRTSTELSQAEAAQKEAERELLSINWDLENRVSERTKEIKKSEAQVRAILESAIDAIVGMDQNGFVTEWNPRAEIIFGWKKSETLGRKMSELIIPERYRAMHEKGISHFVKTGEGPVLNKSIEIAAIRKSGEEFPIELSITPLKVDDKFIFTAFLSDITQRKEDELKLKNLNTYLERAATEAKQASESKSFFLANMSHEIRTPLNGVIGMTGLVLDTELSQQQKEYMEIIRSSADSLLSVINDILDLSKIESGKMDMENIEFEVASLVSDMAKSMKLSAQQKGLDLKIDIPKDVTVNVMGDPGRLRQVLLNLLSNAIKFTENGDITIRIRDVSNNKDAESIDVRFEVEDSGIGISESTLKKLFQPFTQADSSTSRKFGGTGLGLSICQRLVELMGGKIGVKSLESKGSLFWIELSLQKSLNAHDEPAHLYDSPLQTNVTGKILVVEDNFVNQKIARVMLEKAGHKVDTVGNGLEAIHALENIPYDLVLMDCQMPEMDGFEATKVIRSSENPKLPKNIIIIAMTANALSGDKERCLEAGMNDYISKPVNARTLQNTLQKWLS